MPTPPLSKEKAAEAVSTVSAYGGNITDAASALGLSRNTLDARLRTAKRLYRLSPEVPVGFSRKIKLLLLDIETAPNLATVWGLYDQNISLNQLIKPGYTLSWAAKWHGAKDVMFDSIMSGHRRMIRRMHKLVSEADAICHYNGNKFDIPTLNKEFLLMGLPPPSPAKQIDLLITAKRRFRLASNKLDFVAKSLGLGSKVEHKGHELWLECMNRDKEAWKTMEAYNKHDVVLLEKVYDRLLPWIEGHPNMSVLLNTFCCPKCASSDYTQHKTVNQSTGIYRRYQCNPCGAWFRINIREQRQRTKAIAI